MCIRDRNTNGSHNDDITNGIICSKEYFLNNVLIHTEKIFDSRIEYSFVSKQLENKEFTVDEAGALLCNEYEVNKDTARNDANELCRQWLETGLAIE